MDLERIKQNLRLRSGRPRKSRKQQQPLATPSQNGHIPESGLKQPPRVSAQDQSAQTGGRESATAKEQQDQPASLTVKAEDGDQEQASDPGPKSATPEDQHLPKQDDPEGPASPRPELPTHNSSDGDDRDFELRPPAPKPRAPSIETTSELLFSAGHLNAILHDQQSIAHFTTFLSKYKPEYQPLITRYLETQKAIKAVEYANAVARGASLSQDAGSNVSGDVPNTAASLDKVFEEASTAAFDSLVGEALPIYVTYRLVKLVSECLMSEIAGKQSVVMQSLVGGLSEVFCISDPRQADNPIVYASEEFYRYTGYASDDVIGQNCRFLQGPKTLRASPRRLKEAIAKGEEICETLLNYTRDGRPFVNLLMIAPLHDNEGKMKYLIGAQVDVTGLVENGRGLDTFRRYLLTRQTGRGRQTANSTAGKKNALTKLRELSEMFDLEESAVVQTHSQASSVNRDDDSRSIESANRPKALRRLFVSDSDSESNDDNSTPPSDADKEAWKLAQEGPSGQASGRLPGVYDTYMLIRPAPSLRIIFVSKRLQKAVKTVQTRFLAHVAASRRTLTGLKESFLAGVPVSAKIKFMPEPGESRDGIKLPSGYKHEDDKNGKACWISATPLLGSDDRAGVWMVVFVEKAKATGRRSATSSEIEAKVQAEAEANRLSKAAPRNAPLSSSTNRTTHDKTQGPIRPVRLDSQAAVPQLGNQQRVTDQAAPVKEQSTPLPEAPNRQSGKEAYKPYSNSVIKTRSPPHVQPPNIEDPDRVIIQPSPTDEKNQEEAFRGRDATEPSADCFEPVANETDLQHDSNPASRMHLDLEQQRKYTPPPVIDSNMIAQTPRTEEGERKQVHKPASDDEDLETPVATRMHTRRSSGDLGTATNNAQRPSELDRGDEDDADSGLGEAAEDDENKDSHARKPTVNGGPGRVMDYLSHPGSAGRRRVNAEEFERSVHAGRGGNVDEWSDIDCLRSPYSVD